VKKRSQKSKKKAMKKMLRKAKKKLIQANATLQNVEQKELSQLTSNEPTPNILIIHFGVGTENDFTNMIKFLEAKGVEDPHLDIFPGFPHAFLQLPTAQKAQNLMESLQKMPETELECRLAQISYLPRERMNFFFYASVSRAELCSEKMNRLPDAKFEIEIPGLMVFPDFVSEEEEKRIFEEIDCKEWDSLKKRRVQHYGHEFLYGVNKLNLEKEMGPLPSWLDPGLGKLNDICREFNNGENLDQLTVNEYMPGQGIPPHVDSHSPFKEAVAIVSIGSGIVMCFKNPEGDQKHVYLPRRSAYIITGESRYGWYHSIPLRKLDRVEGRIKFRQRRVSLTFRTARTEPCQCNWPVFCDSRGYHSSFVKIPNKLNGKLNSKKVISNDAEEQKIIDVAVNSEENQKSTDMEKKYVYEVYEKIAGHFSNTRHKPWPQVEKFLMSLPKGSVVADVGCGNGKYLGVNPELVMIGTDITSNLLKICVNEKNGNVFRADSLKLPVREGIFDYAISVAVIHHFSNKLLRQKALRELLRIIKIGGKLLVTVWAFEQNKNFGSNDVFVPWNLDGCYHKKNVEEGMEEDENIEQKGEEGEARPEVYKDQKKQTVVYKRYYHLFVFKELENLAEDIEGVKIVQSFYDRDNWCCIFEKTG
jgi:alkylated DNA repair protein alkB family protein 8